MRIQQMLVVAMVVWSVATPTGFAFQADVLGAKPIDNSVARLIPVEFPLTAVDETRLIETLDRMASRSNGQDRPVVVLEFAGKKETTASVEDTTIGRGTEFVRALGLARWLGGPKGSRIRSVAYIPSTICGHAVLVALSCEEIAIATLRQCCAPDSGRQVAPQ